MANISDKTQIKTKRIELLSYAITLTAENSKLLSYVANGDVNQSKEQVLSIKEMLNSILSKIEEIQQAENKEFSGTTFHSTVVAVENPVNPVNPRELSNGGMAPPKEWKSITDLNLKSYEKNSLLEEMRKLKDSGLTVNKSNFHHKQPVSIEEFTEPFKYLENLHDYNGAFLITLLKSDIEISNQALSLNVDLTDCKLKISNGEALLLYIYDISGSHSSGEEKKFLIMLDFDKFNGTLAFNRTIKNVSMSTRQLNELSKFCKSKKIQL